MNILDNRRPYQNPEYEFAKPFTPGVPVMDQLDWFAPASAIHMDHLVGVASRALAELGVVRSSSTDTSTHLSLQVPFPRSNSTLSLFYIDTLEVGRRLDFCISPLMDNSKTIAREVEDSATPSRLPALGVHREVTVGMAVFSALALSEALAARQPQAA